jgi:hypothetical protein
MFICFQRISARRPKTSAAEVRCPGCGGWPTMIDPFEARRSNRALRRFECRCGAEIWEEFERGPNDREIVREEACLAQVAARKPI